VILGKYDIWVITVIQQHKLRWYGKWLSEKCMDYEVERVIPRGRPKKSWSEVTKKRLWDPTNMQGRCYGLQEM